MLVLIRGAGEMASGIATRLKRSGFDIAMTDIPNPTSIRRLVCFSEALVYGHTTVEDVSARGASCVEEAASIIKRGEIAVLADPQCLCRETLRPDALVDAILAKRNLGTRITDAPIVVGVGPGFTAGADCHAVVETMRGHSLGRVIYEGSALPNTNIPGLIGGFAGERVLRAPADGAFHAIRQIGDLVTQGDTVGYVAGKPMCCTISGVLRGLIADGTAVHPGMKVGDVDPRGDSSYCNSVSDKAMAVGGGAMEAILHLSRILKRQSAGG